MTLDQAITVVGRRVIADLVEQEIGELWERYPEIGEHDWEEISAWVNNTTFDAAPLQVEFNAAYDWFAARAETNA